MNENTNLEIEALEKEIQRLRLELEIQRRQEENVLIPPDASFIEPADIIRSFPILSVFCGMGAGLLTALIIKKSPNPVKVLSTTGSIIKTVSGVAKSDIAKSILKQLSGWHKK